MAKARSKAAKAKRILVDARKVRKVERKIEVAAVKAERNIARTAVKAERNIAKQARKVRRLKL